MKCYLVSYNGISNSGGVERVCHYIKKIMENKGIEVDVVDKDYLTEYWLYKLVRFIFRNVPLLVYALISSIYLIFNKRKDDIVITNGFNCPLVKADILFVHGTMKGYAIKCGYNVGFKAKLPMLFEKVAAHRARFMVAVSSNAIREVREIYNVNKSDFVILNNMVDEEAFYPIDSDNDLLNIIFCGRLDPGKGTEKMKRLCEYIDNNNIKARFLIATNVSNHSDEFTCYKCADITVGLNIHQMNNFYNGGDVMFFPSKYEGFEMVTLEALCAGVPVLGNDVGAVSELKSRNEPGVGLIASDEPSIILEQLNELKEQYSSMEERKALHEYYSENYGVKAYSEKLDKILTKILS